MLLVSLLKKIKKSKIAKIPRFTLQKLPTITFRFTGNSLLQDSALLRGYFKTPNSLQSNFYDFVTTFTNLGDVKYRNYGIAANQGIISVSSAIKFTFHYRASEMN